MQHAIAWIALGTGESETTDRAGEVKREDRGKDRDQG
jgi:hypothetical protein